MPARCARSAFLSVAVIVSAVAAVAALLGWSIAIKLPLLPAGRNRR